MYQSKNKEILDWTKQWPNFLENSLLQALSCPKWSHTFNFGFTERSQEQVSFSMQSTHTP